MLTKETGYVLRVLAFLRDQDRRISIEEVAEILGIPRHFLAKLIQRIQRFGWIHTQKGPGGGVALAVDPASLRVMDIVQALEGNRLDRCILGLPVCHASQPCPIHSKWEPLKNLMVNLFESTRLADLVFETPMGCGKESSNRLINKEA